MVGTSSRSSVCSSTQTLEDEQELIPTALHLAQIGISYG